MADETLSDSAEQTIAWSFEDLISGGSERGPGVPAIDRRAYLVADLDHTPPRLVAVENGLLVGRSGAASLEINDESVSRRHAQIHRMPDGEFLLEDLNSTNGTLVNGVRRKEHQLQAGDRIQFGKTKPFLVNFHSRSEDYLLQMQRVELETTWAAGTAVVMRSMLDPLQNALDSLREVGAHVPLGPAGVAPSLRELERCMNRLREYIDKLLAFSRCVVQERSAVDVSSLMHTVAMQVTLPGDRPIKIVTNIQPHLWTTGSSDLLVDAFKELYSNAIDAMPKGGKLEIRIEEIELSSEEAYSKPHLPAGPNLLVEIADTGTGLTQTSRRISKPFFTTKTANLAMGFGLMMAQRIIGVHRGYLEFYGRSGGGTACRIYLPLTDEPGQGI